MAKNQGLLIQRLPQLGQTCEMHISLFHVTVFLLSSGGVRNHVRTPDSTSALNF